jgi:hypothetical protein
MIPVRATVRPNAEKKAGEEEDRPGAWLWDAVSECLGPGIMSRSPQFRNSMQSEVTVRLPCKATVIRIINIGGIRGSSSSTRWFRASWKWASASLWCFALGSVPTNGHHSSGTLFESSKIIVCPAFRSQCHRFAARWRRACLGRLERNWRQRLSLLSGAAETPAPPGSFAMPLNIIDMVAARFCCSRGILECHPGRLARKHQLPRRHFWGDWRKQSVGFLTFRSRLKICTFRTLQRPVSKKFASLSFCREEGNWPSRTERSFIIGRKILSGEWNDRHLFT